MTLSAGTHLGPYEILAPLGAGGMGEVYRARDPRLGREVAIKVLPASYSQDTDRLKRFEQEARAAGVLNHPNIMAVYDIGTHEGAPYVVSELLEGETLRARLAVGALPPRKAIEFAVQIAQGLAAAHEKGIVHRDLKPENLFVTRDGRVKILDFGLAKLIQPEEKEPQTELPTATEPGVVLGTLGYMSPEQVRGQAADTRSDIFSFGAILYEMLSGSRAFSGGSAADTMSAILVKEPPDLSVTNQSITPGLERIVRHCLEKNPEERFHSAHDLAFDLEALSGISAPSGRAAAVTPHASRTRVGIGLAAVAVVAAAVAGAFVAGRKTGLRPLPSFQQLSFRRGRIAAARFGPGGQNVVYSAEWEGNPPQLFSTRPGSSDTTSLQVPSARLLAVAPSGELALQLSSRFARGFTWTGTLARAPLAGGAAREVLEATHWADWSPDGSELAVVRDFGGKNRLEFPIGKPLYETGGFVSYPRVSPKGDLVAFLDHPQHGDDGGSVAIVDKAGKKRTLSSGWSSEDGLAWGPRGEEVWFTATKVGGARALWAVGLSGRERLLARVTGPLTLHDVASDGRVLLTHDTSREGILALAPGETKERDLSWLDWSLVRGLSADGKTILFDESGEGSGTSYSVGLRKTDGSPAVKLGEGAAMALSPDGKWVASIPRGEPAQLVLLPTGSGESRRITNDSINHVSAAFFPDGKRILFGGSEPGRGVRFYVQDLEGGKPRAVSPEGVELFAVAISPDGGRFAAVAPGGETWLYPIAGGQPERATGVQAGESPICWSRDGRWLYVRDVSRVPTRIFRVDLLGGQRELWKEIAPSDTSGLVGIFGVRAAPEAGAYAYTYGRILSDLYVASGIK
ncbi:MAG TPA: protein kinase [Thermoanaerobaculia bacterium]|nr:protein kinase [Thermoanaerobaculia bacterium]